MASVRTIASAMDELAAGVHAIASAMDKLQCPALRNQAE
jgi:hypothetical protein